MTAGSRLWALFFIVLALLPLSASAATFEVCATCAYTTIHQAVEAAPPDSRIHIQKGVYKEDEILVTKPLTFDGEDGAILDGDGRNQILTIVRTDNVRIQGLTIQNTGTSYVRELAGVRVIESSNCSISHNRFIDTTYAVYLENAKNCLVEDNLISGHTVSETAGGNGIHVWYGESHLISRNKINGHRDGIYLEFAKGSRIIANISQENIRYGLHFMSSNETTYENNEFLNNGAGVAVMYSRKIKMFGNRFHHNLGPAAYGLLMKDVFESEVSGNEFTANTVGIFIEGSNRSKFENNLFRKNGWALRIMGDCENNQFNRNDFVANTFEVTTNADHSWNVFAQNYWGQYEGYDLDRNGIGDIPHRPVSLSSIILERTDSSYILMNSFFFAVMDKVERALPGLIPEPLKDEQPAMRPIKVWDEKK